MESKVLRVVEAAMRIICYQPKDDSERRLNSVYSQNEKIDYNHLAEEVINQIGLGKEIQENKNESEEDNTDLEKENLSNEEKTEKLERGRIDGPAMVFSAMASLFISLFGLFILLFAVGTFIREYNYLCDAEWGTGLRFFLTFFEAFMMDIMGVAAITLSMFMFMAARQIGVEKDRNYIVAVFSATTSMIALIAALVALFK